MTGTPTPIACPWCTTETADTDTFRTHLMVEHRKSELAAYVLNAEQSQRAETPTEPVETSTTASDDADDESEQEREVLAR